MMTTFKITIEYDGSAYHGWQIQPNCPTIQAQIETVLTTMTRQSIRLIGSGRTDAGVHAIGQTAHFKCDTAIEPQALQKGLNSLLPDDIVIHSCEPMPDNFHARFSAKSKTYQYTIMNHQLPPAIGRQYVWWIRRCLDVNAMSKAAHYLLGHHDFKTFEGAGSPRAHTVRQVMRADVQIKPQNRITITLQADGFLRFMMRNIVGTLVEVGLRKISPEQFKSILEACSRTKAGATAPPQGLCLVEVNYNT